MAIPVSYNLRNLIVRKTTTIMTALGITLTVAVLLSVLALLNGLQTAFESSADPLQLLVMRKGSNAELSSAITRDVYQTVKSMPGIARAEDQSLASLEMVRLTEESGLPPAHVGIASGPVIQQDGDYFGRTVNLASRIAGKAGAREVLVAPEVARLCGDDLAVEFAPVGRADLKGVERTVELFRSTAIR